MRRRGETSTLLVLIALGVTLAVPASASASAAVSAIGVHAGAVAAIEPRFPYAPPDAHSASRSTMSPWLTAATAALIIVSTFALALWRERRRPGDNGFDGGDDSGRGDPDLPRPPRGPGGEDLHWSLFEAEFRDYVRSHERRHTVAIRAE